LGGGIGVLDSALDKWNILSWKKAVKIVLYTC